MKRYYELNYLIHSDLGTEGSLEYQDSLVKKLEETGASLIWKNNPQKIKLAYPIKKQEYAFLGVILFEALPEEILRFDPILKKEENVLRYLIVKKESVEVVQKKKEEPKEEPKEVIEKEPIEKPEEEKNKVDIEELDKKLDEILNESQ